MLGATGENVEAGGVGERRRTATTGLVEHADKGHGDGNVEERRGGVVEGLLVAVKENPLFVVEATGHTPESPSNSCHGYKILRAVARATTSKQQSRRTQRGRGRGERVWLANRQTQKLSSTAFDLNTACLHQCKDTQPTLLRCTGNHKRLPCWIIPLAISVQVTGGVGNNYCTRMRGSECCCCGRVAVVD